MNIQPDTTTSFAESAERMLLSVPPKSVAAYALDSILGFMRKEGAEDLDPDILKLWIASMSMQGKKLSTCRRYFGKVHSMWAGRGGESGNDIFTQVLPLFGTLREADIREAEGNLDLVKRLLGRNERSEDRETAGIFFWLLYNPDASLTDAVNLTFADAPRFCPQADDIVDSFDSSYGRKYVFRLNQGKTGAREISRKVTKDLQTLLASVGMRFVGGFSRTSVTSMWIAAAYGCGVSVRDIRACVGTVPPEYSPLSIVDKRKLGASEKEKIICAVADAVSDCAARWFVMKLRQGVSAEDIRKRIGDRLPEHLAATTLFYPTRTEIRMDGNRRVVREIPYISNILFFKTRTNRVKSLFAGIGDLAWCFRTSNSPDSGYAVISNRQMAVFQQCIGRFTPDIKLEIVDALQTLGKGRRVRVTGGIMAGYEGEILDVENEAGKRVFFLSISESSKARWTAHVDDVFIQPLE